MDLTTQKKLTKSEWDSIEISVSENEKKILNVIMNGYSNINIKYNDNLSLAQFLKMSTEENPELEVYFFKEYFAKEIEKMILPPKKKMTQSFININELLKKWFQENNPTASSSQKIKKVEIMKVQNLSANIQQQKPIIFEFTLLSLSEKMFSSLRNETDDYGLFLYTLIQFKKISIPQINSIIIKFVDFVIDTGLEKTNLTNVFHRSFEFIEKNPYLLKYQDISLFPHQKNLFTIFNNNTKRDTPKLVLYSAPTGTGKTLSPLGLSVNYKIIFVCVARHVGLALAKSAISVNKKVAFAFGCETASDVRLHNFAAINYTVNRKSGGIYKIDNSIGDNVEIMICDVKSYIIAMHYMLAFNNEDKLITYWDEPTISMDYNEHPLHEIIHDNWTKNIISKVVLSCATLPKETEIIDTIIDFKSRFENAEIHNITSYDCKKSIPMINKDGKCVLPHLFYENYGDLVKCLENCNKNKSILRYFDLEEIISFIEYINNNGFIENIYNIESYFKSISDITMDSIKIYYLELLNKINPLRWSLIYSYCNSTQKYKFEKQTPESRSLRKVASLSNERQTIDGGAMKKMNSVSILSAPSQTKSEHRKIIPTANTPTTNTQTENPAKGILLTTTDAHTLTDGPTIFLAEDVEKIGKFYIQQTKIPDKVFKEIMNKIKENDDILKKIQSFERTMEDLLGKDASKEKKMERELLQNREVNKMMETITSMQTQIKVVNLDSKFVPNMRQHQMLWNPDCEIVENAFTPNLDEESVREIMATNVDDQMKLLLLLGIGTFTPNLNNDYIEIMKRLASNQQLFIIIAQTDYIYGTNYQFCHGFIGKDLTNMTQQKIIQSMGRIGRGNIQQEYTIRFRDNNHIKTLFEPDTINLEAVNMSRLFSSPQ
jgi:hypothetical protein